MPSSSRANNQTYNMKSQGRPAVRGKSRQLTGSTGGGVGPLSIGGNSITAGAQMNAVLVEAHYAAEKIRKGHLDDGRKEKSPIDISPPSRLNALTGDKAASPMHPEYEEYKTFQKNNTLKPLVSQRKNIRSIVNASLNSNSMGLDLNERLRRRNGNASEDAETP